MKNTIYLFLILLIIFSMSGFVFVKGKTNGNLNVADLESGLIRGEAQKVVLSMVDYNYYPQEVKVKANEPVEITLDESVYGCLRSFTIRDLGISKILRTPEDKLTFTPKQPGIYTFACSMGMGYGKLIVE